MKVRVLYITVRHEIYELKYPIVSTTDTTIMCDCIECKKYSAQQKKTLGVDGAECNTQTKHSV
jgi:hypothetical protein